MKSLSGALLVSGGDCGLRPVGAVTTLGEHRHYCSTCRSYWDHADGHCANLGHTMICTSCAHQLLGGQAQATTPDSVTVQATDWSKTGALIFQEQ